jgi:MFS transporter, OFA family, oxalate/formate antiporter
MSFCKLIAFILYPVSNRKLTLKRYRVLAASVLMQMCLGATYSWSVYVQPLKAITGLPQGPTQLPFTVFYFAFPLTMIFAGYTLPRLGPRRCAVIGGLLFGMGWITASWGSVHFGLTVLGIGLLAGIGVGFAYIVPIATCIRWFPAHKGLVTGIAVAGFGGGAALVSRIGAWLMNAYGLTPFETFRLLGIAFMVIVVSAGWGLQNPPGTRFESTVRLKWRALLAQRRFRILYLAMGCGLAAGFAINANLKELLPGGSIGVGVTAVGLFALTNAAGRIVWGGVFDRLPGRIPVGANLVCQTLILLASPWILISETGLLLFAALTGFNYGGVLVLYAASVARIWGRASVGQVYGLLFSANIPAALAPLAAGFWFDALGRFTPALWLIAAMLLVATLLLLRAPFELPSTPP